MLEILARKQLRHWIGNIQSHQCRVDDAKLTKLSFSSADPARRPAG
jgi:hypothetical protein